MQIYIWWDITIPFLWILTILQIFYSSKNIRRDRYLKQIHALHFLITIKERSKRRASPKISQKVVSFNFAEKSKHVYSFLFFLSTIASVLLGLTPPSFRFFQFPSRIRGKEKKFEKRGETRAREREREKMEGTGDRGTRTGIYGGEISLRRCPLSYRVSTARRNFCPPGHVQPRNRYAEEKISMFIAMRTSVPRRT